MWNKICSAEYALRRQGIMPPKRPAAGGESHERDSFLFNRKIPLLNKNRSAALLAGFVLVVKISFVNKEKKEE